MKFKALSIGVILATVLSLSACKSEVTVIDEDYLNAKASSEAAEQASIDAANGVTSAPETVAPTTKATEAEDDKPSNMGDITGAAAEVHVITQDKVQSTQITDDAQKQTIIDNIRTSLQTQKPGIDSSYSVNVEWIIYPDKKTMMGGQRYYATYTSEYMRTSNRSYNHLNITGVSHVPTYMDEVEEHLEESDEDETLDAEEESTSVAIDDDTTDETTAAVSNPSKTFSPDEGDMSGKINADHTTYLIDSGETTLSYSKQYDVKREDPGKIEWLGAIVNRDLESEVITLAGIDEKLDLSRYVVAEETFQGTDCYTLTCGFPLYDAIKLLNIKPEKAGIREEDSQGYTATIKIYMQRSNNDIISYDVSFRTAATVYYQDKYTNNDIMARTYEMPNADACGGSVVINKYEGVKINIPDEIMDRLPDDVKLVEDGGELNETGESQDSIIIEGGFEMGIGDSTEETTVAPEESSANIEENSSESTEG